jgi:peptidoglycan/xylan/chitin deacetylase (PgdA/CDA1 family)
MKPGCLLAVFAACFLTSAGTCQAEDIPIPLAPATPQDDSPPRPAPYTAPTDPAEISHSAQLNPGSGSLAYPVKAETNVAPAAERSGSSMALHPETAAPARPRPGLHRAVNTARKAVALTFDDGPHGKLTPQLLDVLQREQVPATFFVLGSLVEAHPQIVRRMAAEGHEVANHTWDHPKLTSLNDQQLERQIRDTTAIIEENTGQKVTLMRPTYGLYNDRVKDQILGKYQLDMVLWSVDPKDWKKPGSDTVARRLVQGARPGAILLAHDIHPGTIAAAPKAIAALKAKGFEFVTVSQLLAMEEAPSPTPHPPELAGKQHGDAAERAPSKGP